MKCVIVEYMKMRGITYAELAEKMGVSAGTLHTTVRSDMRLSTLYKIAEALECKPWDLIVEDDFAESMNEDIEKLVEISEPPVVIPSNVNKVIKRYMDMIRMSTYELASRLGKSQSTVHAYFDDGRVLRPKLVQHICCALGLSIRDLLSLCNKDLNDYELVRRASFITRDIHDGDLDSDEDMFRNGATWAWVWALGLTDEERERILGGKIEEAVKRMEKALGRK